MTLFDLVAKISLDSSGYEKGLAAAKKSSDQYKKDVMSLAQTYKKQGMEMSDAMKRAYSEIDKSQYSLGSGAQKAAGGFSDAWKNAFSGLQDGAKKLEPIADKIIKIGAAAAGAAVAGMTAFAKSAVSTGQEFDTAMSQVAATMGVSVYSIQDLREYAQKMGAETVFSATEAAQA